ncbi:LamG-like jellyroll fold domain-containing protein [Inquilinus limosus]|uniref:LamG-like jellyroll fold domain-containing protein n=1 Tax=Inquilinus limosus TaxID=171674 RepID=UPI00041B5CD2|nr:LamG-like jellyroll fold domain-containing protein [Inquilinus limosus]
MLGTRIVTHVVATNPNLPSVPMPSVLTSISGCLAAWEFRSRSDATGNVPMLPAGLTFSSTGLVLPGGTFAVATGLKPSTPYCTVALAAMPAADISATGYFLGSLASTSGFGMNFDSATNQVAAVQIKSDGSVAATTATTQPKGEWFGLVVAVNTTQIWGLVDAGSNISSPTYTSGALAAPTNQLYLGSREGAGSGLKCTLGALAVYDHYLDDTGRTQAMGLLRQVMATKGVTLPGG